MIQEEYVSFETAKLLKEKGFPQVKSTTGCFMTGMLYSISTDGEGKHRFVAQYPERIYNKDRYIAAPTQQMACRWLRETHKIDIITFHEILDTEFY